MNGFEKIIYALQGNSPHQTVFGWFHFLFLGLTIIATVLMCVFLPKVSTKTHKIVLFVSWLIMLLLEIYKQLVYSFEYVDGKAVWDYQWYAFPFQFCSSPLYILPFAIFIKKDSAREYFESFLGFFALFGGLVVMLYPGDVYNTSYIGVAIQSMVHHGLMVAIGIYLLVKNKDKLNIKYYLKSLVVFVAMLVVATILNETIIFATKDSFNMFYISRHFDCTMPLLSIIYQKLPYPVFLIVYIVGFAIAGMVMFLVAKLIKLICDKIAQKKGKTNVPNA